MVLEEKNEKKLMVSGRDLEWLRKRYNLKFSFEALQKFLTNIKKKLDIKLKFSILKIKNNRMWVLS